VRAEQLELFGKVLPWGGQSPRGLTRGRKALFLSQEAEKDACDRSDRCQLDLFQATIFRAPRVYRGAPLLKEV